jgi:hypothetical protein|nr:MAG TPA: hypothetical protein [Caudoviricetes sp.]DAU90633.1 MAG TPA: hypothetical protein [Bacteriophage sp.]
MYIPETIFTQSVARSVLRRFVKDVVAFDEKPHSARAKLECVDRYCDLLDFLVQEERLKAVALELSIILDENTDDKHLRKALEDSMIRTSASLKILYEKHSALERGRRNN